MKNGEKVLHYLKTKAIGQNNAVFGADIGDEFGLVDAQIRRIVNEARRNGVPICSSRHGYYYAENASDIKATIEGLYSRIENVLAAIDGLQGALTQMVEVSPRQEP